LLSSFGSAWAVPNELVTGGLAVLWEIAGGSNSGRGPTGLPVNAFQKSNPAPAKMTVASKLALYLIQNMFSHTPRFPILRQVWFRVANDPGHGVIPLLVSLTMRGIDRQARSLFTTSPAFL